jgi:hypothetical protein
MVSHSRSPRKTYFNIKYPSTSRMHYQNLKNSTLLSKMYRLPYHLATQPFHQSHSPCASWNKKKQHDTSQKQNSGKQNFTTSSHPQLSTNENYTQHKQSSNLTLSTEVEVMDKNARDCQPFISLSAMSLLPHSSISLCSWFVTDTYRWKVGSACRAGEEAADHPRAFFPWLRCHIVYLMA